MERWPKIRRLVKVDFTPQEFMSCVNTIEEKMRRARSRDRVCGWSLSENTLAK
jgi:hypothetical protein